MNKPSNRVVLLGPSSERYKGGAAQFTHQLADQLSKISELHFFSWSQLYPPFLISRDFRDSVSKSKTGSTQANFILAYMNPLSWFRFIKAVIGLKPQMICLTWVHPVHAPIYLIINFFLKLRTNAELVYICHNVSPHETFPGARFLSKLCFKQCDRMIVHGRSELEDAKKLVGKKKITQLYLPLFNFFASNSHIGAAASKDRKNQILFFGNIREYKGLDILIKAFAVVVKKRPDLHLKIVGEKFYEGHAASDPLALIEELGLEESITTDIRYVPNEEIPSIFSDVALAVFPYRSASQSGPLTVAYSYGVPVIATRVGGLPDVISEGESGYLVEPNRPDLLADAIGEFFKNPLTSRQVRSFASRLSWKRYAEGLLYDMGFVASLD